MLAGLVELVLHPDTFFARVSKEKVNLIPPLVIVGTGIIFMVLGQSIALAYYALTSPYHGNPVIFTGQIWYFLRCFAIIPLITWGILSLGMYGLSRILKGKGTLAETIQNIGYGMIPWAASVISMTGFTVILFFATYISPSRVIPLEELVPYAYEYIDLLILFWGLYLWILAVRHTHGFTLRKAVAVSIVPALIVIWLTIPVQAWIETIRMVIFGI